ncbi:hypothetical protein PUG81_24790 [Erwiniaceae bacterium L1_54_6]|nr:hypothetical protein [Erwiniaceae bacterium L1_54_6]
MAVNFDRSYHSCFLYVPVFLQTLNIKGINNTQVGISDNRRCRNFVGREIHLSTASDMQQTSEGPVDHYMQKNVGPW